MAPASAGAPPKPAISIADDAGPHPQLLTRYEAPFAIAGAPTNDADAAGLARLQPVAHLTMDKLPAAASAFTDLMRLMPRRAV